MILVGDWAPGVFKVKPLALNGFILTNLEGPILSNMEEFQPCQKAGPLLYSHYLPDSQENFLFSLANNHIMDYGYSGLKSTLSKLPRNSWIGAGDNLLKARNSKTIIENGHRIGIISCCEAQFGVARLQSPGVAEFGPWVYKAIKELKKKVDFVVISVHAGIEDSPWPSKYLTDLYHSYIDAGADIIHGHHSHVPQGYEMYNDGLIFYGLGNFAIDPTKWGHRSNGMWSLGASIDFSSNTFTWQLMTFEICHKPDTNFITIEQSNFQEKSEHLDYLDLCNQPLRNPELLDALWQEIALNAYFRYGERYMHFKNSSPANMSIKDKVKINLNFIKSLYLPKIVRTGALRNQDYLLWHHMFACESHRQMMTTALGILGGEIKDIRNSETCALVKKTIG